MQITVLKIRAGRGPVGRIFLRNHKILAKINGGGPAAVQQRHGGHRRLDRAVIRPTLPAVPTDHQTGHSARIEPHFAGVDTLMASARQTASRGWLRTAATLVIGPNT